MLIGEIRSLCLTIALLSLSRSTSANRVRRLNLADKVRRLNLASIANAASSPKPPSDEICSRMCDYFAKTCKKCKENPQLCPPNAADFPVDCDTVTHSACSSQTCDRLGVGCTFKAATKQCVSNPCFYSEKKSCCLRDVVPGERACLWLGKGSTSTGAPQGCYMSPCVNRYTKSECSKASGSLNGTASAYKCIWTKNKGCENAPANYDIAIC